MRVLLFHNTVAAYRAPLFRSLARLVDLKVCFTDYDLSEKVYGRSDEPLLDGYSSNLISKDSAIFRSVIEEFSWNPDFVVLPTMDSVRDSVIAYCAARIANEKGIPIGYFWEKWEWDKGCVPLKKRLKNAFQKKVASRILKSVLVFWSPGRKTDQYFRSMGIPAAKIIRIHDSSKREDAAYKKDAPGSDSEVVNILYLGRLVSRKGILCLLDALREVKRPFRLDVVGDGPQFEIAKTTAFRYGLNAVFHGRVDPSNVGRFYSSADIFVLPSILENGVVEAWGLTVNEALSAGLFVVVSDVVGSGYDLITEDCGAVFQYGNTSELANIIESYDKSQRDQIAANSIARVSNYTYSQMSRDIVNGIVRVCE